MSRKIIVTIRKGQATIETSGFTGPECQKATAELERALGNKVEDRTTPEFFRQEAGHVVKQ